MSRDRAVCGVAHKRLIHRLAANVTKKRPRRLHSLFEAAIWRGSNGWFAPPLTVFSIVESLMAVPKRKTTPSKRGMRRSHDALSNPVYVEDKDSGELRRPHHVDLKSGMYRGRQILDVKDD